MTRVLILLISALTFCVPCALQGQQQSGVSNLDVPAVFKVSAIAYADFDAKLKAWQKKWVAGGRTLSDSQRYASDIHHYQIEVMPKDNTVLVTFTLKPPGGGAVFGGVTNYVLDAESGSILERSGEK